MYDEKISAARKHYYKQEYSQAIKLYNEAFEEMVVVSDLLDLGLIHLKVDNYAEAEMIFKAVINHDKQQPRAYYGLALINEERLDQEKALKYYFETVKYDSQFDAAYFNIAGIYDEQNNTTKAKKYYQQAIDINENNFWAHINLGAIFEKEGSFTKALNLTLTAYKINPAMKKVCFNLGVIYSRIKDFDNAIKYYHLELENDDHYQITYLNLGLLYKDIKQDFKTAKMIYIKGIKRDQQDFNLWFNLACIYALEGNFKQTYDCLLYSYTIEPKIIDDIYNDNELQGFRSSKEFQKLKTIIE